MEATITNRMSLVMFAKTYGSLSMGTCTNKTTGEEFKKLCFTHPTNKDEEGNPLRTYVGFSSKLGELTGAEIVAQKDQLQVVTLSSGSHILCKASESTWESIDLGI
jgi:hypothetical protein